ncbi:MAG: preprotein translocase subunit SecG [bacterium]|nr:preprotein translocase subunit SecG [bacterium]
MISILLIFHVLICIVLVLVVLLQSGRDQSLGSAFGGGSSQTLFGTRRGNVLTKATTILAILFMATCLSLAILYTRQFSIFKKERIKVEEKAKEEERAPEKKEEVKKDIPKESKDAKKEDSSKKE